MIWENGLHFFYDFIPNEKYANMFPADWNGGICISHVNGDVEFYQDGIDDPIKKLKFKDYNLSNNPFLIL